MIRTLKLKSTQAKFQSPEYSQRIIVLEIWGNSWESKKIIKCRFSKILLSIFFGKTLLMIEGCLLLTISCIYVHISFTEFSYPFSHNTISHCSFTKYLKKTIKEFQCVLHFFFLKKLINDHISLSVGFFYSYWE